MSDNDPSPRKAANSALQAAPHFPFLVDFMDTTEDLRFDNAMMLFKDKEIDVPMSSREADIYHFSVTVGLLAL